ncbi:MAG: tetratricopeptide repeat protein [candidate division KSB1 bacterium]|nr:tetratricopeptide repeat protein [candidate division KSB1 bacterium]
MNLHDQIQFAEHLFHRGEIEAAKLHLQQLNQRFPQNADVLNNLAVIALQEGNPEIAEDLLLQAFKEENNNPDVLTNLLDIAAQQEHNADVVRLCHYIVTQVSDASVLQEIVQSHLTNIAWQFILSVIEDTVPAFMNDHSRWEDKFGQTNKEQVKSPETWLECLSLTLYNLFVRSAPKEAQKILMNYKNHSLAHHELKLALISALWLYQKRVYECIHFADQLKRSQGDYKDFAEALILRARTVEKNTEVERAYSEILFVVGDDIGDIVMITPTLQAIRQRFPQSRITVLGKKPAVELLIGADFVDEIIFEWQEQQFDIALLSFSGGEWLNEKDFDF